MPEILAIQPFSKFPAMRHGEVDQAESRAIARYIDGLDAGVKLVPEALADAARAEQWIMRFHTEYLPLMLGRYLVQYFFPPLLHDGNSCPKGTCGLIAASRAY